MNFANAISHAASLYGIRDANDISELKNNVFVEFLSLDVTPDLMRIISREARRIRRDQVTSKMLSDSLEAELVGIGDNEGFNSVDLHDTIISMPEDYRCVAELLTVHHVRDAFKMSGMRWDQFEKVRAGIREHLEKTGYCNG